MTAILERLFPETEREGWRDWLNYISCRVAGHKPANDRGVWFCLNCQDTLPRGNKRWQA